MTKDFIYKFIKNYNLGVISTIWLNNKPESALVGIAVSEELEIIFDTVKASRKYRNLLHNPSIAVVIGWDNETTAQCEGIAAEVTGANANIIKRFILRHTLMAGNGIKHGRISFILNYTEMDPVQ